MKYISALLITTALFACGEDGTGGPAGPAGPAGTSGEVRVIQAPAPDPVVIILREEAMAGMGGDIAPLDADAGAAFDPEPEPDAGADASAVVEPDAGPPDSGAPDAEPEPEPQDASTPDADTEPDATTDSGPPIPPAEECNRFCDDKMCGEYTDDCDIVYICNPCNQNGVCEGTQPICSDPGGHEGGWQCVYQDIGLEECGTGDDEDCDGLTDEAECV